MLNFNPRTREGCDALYFSSMLLLQISIHAPAKGATIIAIFVFRRSSISIHAPAKGATTIVQSNVIIIGISIHAPAKGATQGDVLTNLQNVISIHAPAKGATYVCDNALIKDLIFQSTHPRRVRPVLRLLQTSPSTYFNPRTREGCDMSAPFSLRQR